MVTVKHYSEMITLCLFLVVASNTPDPGVLMLPDGMGYTVVATTNLATNATSGAFKILHSNDLISWNEVGMVFLQMFAGVACDFFHSIVKRKEFL